MEYSSKPDYMDGGLKEKKKAGEIRDAIKATKLCNEHFYNANTENTTEFNACERAHPTTPLQNRHIAYQQFREYNTRTRRSPSSSDVRSENDYVQNVQPGWVKASALYTTEGEGGKSNVDNVECLSLSLVDQDSFSSSVYPPSLETMGLSTTNTYSGFSSDATLDLSLISSILIPPTPSKDLESENALLLMHYVDHVLYIQFPFYNDVLSHHGRGWLLSLIATVKPICRYIFDIVRFLVYIHWRESANIELP